MKNFGKFAFFTAILILVFSNVSFAQNAMANKSWNAFWTKFSAAAKAKNVSALLRLSVSENDFSNGGAAGNRRQLIGESLGLIKDSVSRGTMPYTDSRRPARITKNNALIFEYINKRWWFIGFMGD